MQHSLDTTRPYDGIPELIHELKQRGCRLAVVSNKMMAATQELIAHFFPEIDVAIGETEAAGIRKKPAPDTVLEALRQLTSLDPSEAGEVVYVGDLVVESGATLDLHGIALYYTGAATLDGTVTGGTPIHLVKASAIHHYAFPLGTPNTADGLGYWIGDIAAGDFNGDGHTEILTTTVDERSSDEDCHFYALRFANGTLSNVANFPILDYHLDVNRNKYSFWFNFCVGNIGDGNGPALFYDGDGYMRPSAIGADATARYLTENANVHYGKTATLHIDLDNDGVL